MGILDIFGYASGLKINLSKTEVVGINVGDGEMGDLAERIGCVVGSWPMSYLGLPLGDNPRKVSFWNPVIEKVSKRLKGWFKGCLSRGGKLTLIHSVLDSIPTYFLSLFKIPVSVAKTIEKLMRCFLWEGMEKGKSNHLVDWETVSKCKEMGGLGIGNLINRNEALLGKWLWRFPKEHSAFWHRIIRSKYGVLENGWDANKVRRGTFRSPWKAIANGMESFLANVNYRVGNGSRIRFWLDRWVDDMVLKDQFPGLFRVVQNPRAMVADNISWESAHCHSWNVMLRRNVTETEEEEYRALLGSLHGVEVSLDGEDSRVWGGDRNGIFSVKSFFKILTRYDTGSLFAPAEMIWKSGIPPKVRVLAWLAALRKVNTADLVQFRRPFMHLSPSWCVLCKRDSEKIDHLLLHCSFAQKIWNKVRKEFDLIAALPGSWYELLTIKWFFIGDKKKCKTLWRCCCMAVMWCIWRERNKRIFEETIEELEKTWDRIKNLASLWAYSSKNFGILTISEIARDWGLAMQ